MQKGLSEKVAAADYGQTNMSVETEHQQWTVAIIENPDETQRQYFEQRSWISTLMALVAMALLLSL